MFAFKLLFNMGENSKLTSRGHYRELEETVERRPALLTRCSMHAHLVPKRMQGV
jgi:hypothetical protein